MGTMLDALCACGVEVLAVSPASIPLAEPDFQVLAESSEDPDMAVRPCGHANRGSHYCECESRLGGSQGAWWVNAAHQWHRCAPALPVVFRASIGLGVAVPLFADSAMPDPSRPTVQGFDEYMNLVLDEAEEVSVKRETRKPLGRILLKGDNITLMQTAKA